MQNKISGLIMAALLAIGLGSTDADAQDTLPITSSATASRQAYELRMAQKHQIRVARAQFRSNLSLMGDEMNTWFGYDPHRPVWNTGTMFNVPYQNYFVPVVPVGRSISYYGYDQRAF